MKGLDPGVLVWSEELQLAGTVWSSNTYGICVRFNGVDRDYYYTPDGKRRLLGAGPDIDERSPEQALQPLDTTLPSRRTRAAADTAASALELHQEALRSAVRRFRSCGPDKREAAYLEAHRAIDSIRGCMNDMGRLLDV